MWRDPIYDRTALDIEQRTPKAFCNTEDLIRLEENCAYLAGLLGVSISTRSWLDTDMPTVASLARIRSNIATLRAASPPPSSTPVTPANPLNHWQKWNDAEKILNDLYWAYIAVRDAVIYAGEHYAGQTIGVI